MFVKRKHYDELNKRVADLAKALDKLNNESKYTHDESKDLRDKHMKDENFIKEITKLAECNKYNNEKIFISKIKELVTDYQSQN